VIPQQVGDFSLGYVEYFTRTTSVRNQIYSVIKEPHCASVESFQLLSLLAQSYSRSISCKPKSKSKPFLTSPLLIASRCEAMLMKAGSFTEHLVKELINELSSK
jgi:hypothetical protein